MAKGTSPLDQSQATGKVMLCVLTPAGRGAVASIALAGPASGELLAQFFRSSSGLPARTLGIGRIVHGRWHDELGEEVVVCRRGDQEFEIHCHGGAAAIERIAEDLTSRGAERTSWNDWLRRAGADPLSADAWEALPSARTKRTAAILLAQAHGALSSEIAGIIAALHAQELRSALERLQALAARSAVGRHLVAPFRVVIAGPPNVGKSSLINALLGYERAIVFDRPGTTRDVVTAETAIDGWPVTLSDTAGLRATVEPIENEGIARARAHLEDCDLAILVSDARDSVPHAPPRPADEQTKTIFVANKIDLLPGGACPGDRGRARTSATSGAGIAELLHEIGARLVPNPPAPQDAVPFTDRQSAIIAQGITDLSRGDTCAAVARLAALLAPARD